MIRRIRFWYRGARALNLGVLHAVRLALSLRDHEPYVIHPYEVES